MNITSAKFEIKPTENYYNLTDISADPKYVLANVPKFMPKIKIGNPTLEKGAINRAMFCNAPDCKPKPSTVMEMQNFITLARHPSRQIYLGSRINMSGNRIKKKTKLTLEVMHGDIRKLYITDKE